MKEMEVLIEKYFDGATTCEEERTLRRFFATGQVPPHLEIYRPLFAYLDQEAEKHRHAEPAIHTRRKPNLRFILRLAGSIAAGILLCLGLVRLLPFNNQAENFVVIDGQRYTDPALVQAKAQEALLNVSYTDEELNQLLFPLEP